MDRCRCGGAKTDGKRRRVMKYILELEDEPNKEYFGEGNYYRCKQIPYWSISESMKNRLEQYDEADGKKRVMTLEQNITAILESCFSGFKDELIESCAKRIMEQIERQADTPQTEDYDFRDEQEYNDRWQTDCGWK